MKNIKKFLFLMMMGIVEVQAYQLNNTSNDSFIGNNRLDITVKGGQAAEIKGFLVNGEVYGYLDIEDMNSNECYFEAGTEKIDWDKAMVSVQYSYNFGCTVARPRLCCIEMPDEF